MISNYLFLGSILTSSSLAVLLIYNVIYFINKRFFSKNYTKNEARRREKYKKNSIYIGIILIFLLAFIMIYTRPMSIYQIAKLDKDDDINRVELFGSISGSDTSELNSEDSEKLLELFDKYKYRRTFNFNIGGEGERITFEYKGYKYVNFEVWKGDYVRVPNYKVYKIVSKDNKEFYNLLKEKVMDFLIHKSSEISNN